MNKPIDDLPVEVVSGGLTYGGAVSIYADIDAVPALPIGVQVLHCWPKLPATVQIDKDTLDIRCSAADCQCGKEHCAPPVRPNERPSLMVLSGRVTPSRVLAARRGAMPASLLLFDRMPIQELPPHIWSRVRDLKRSITFHVYLVADPVNDPANPLHDKLLAIPVRVP